MKKNIHIAVNRDYKETKIHKRNQSLHINSK